MLLLWDTHDTDVQFVLCGWCKTEEEEAAANEQCTPTGYWDGIEGGFHDYFSLSLVSTPLFVGVFFLSIYAWGIIANNSGSRELPASSVSPTSYKSSSSQISPQGKIGGKESEWETSVTEPTPFVCLDGVGDERCCVHGVSVFLCRNVHFCTFCSWRWVTNLWNLSGFVPWLICTLWLWKTIVRGGKENWVCAVKSKTRKCVVVQRRRKRSSSPTCSKTERKI